MFSNSFSLLQSPHFVSPSIISDLFVFDALSINSWTLHWRLILTQSKELSFISTHLKRRSNSNVMGDVCLSLTFFDMRLKIKYRPFHKSNRNCFEYPNRVNIICNKKTYRFDTLMILSSGFDLVHETKFSFWFDFTSTNT